jgi:hypothetical protein
MCRWTMDAAERYAFILELRRNGATLQTIGDRLNITRQRVWWLLQGRAQRQARGRPCPACGAKSKVWRTHPPDKGGVTKREHRCMKCPHLWVSRQVDE